MTTFDRWAIRAGSVTVAALCIWGGFGLAKHTIALEDAWKDAAPAKGGTDALVIKATAALPSAGKLDAVAQAVTDGVNKVAAVGPVATAALEQTTTNLNRPCKGPDGPDACGTLAGLNKTAVKIGDAIVTTQLQERAATPHVIAAMDSFKDAATALSGTATSGSAALGTLNRLLGSKDLSDALSGLSQTSQNAGAITGDFKNRFHELLYPPPCHRWGCVAKYAWPVIKEAPAFGEALYWTKQLFDNVPAAVVVHSQKSNPAKEEAPSESTSPR